MQFAGIAVILISAAAIQVAAQGKLVDVGGHKLNLVCVGAGNPTVVFEAGSGDTSAIWERVQQALGRQTRSCAYDRAGTGSSQQGPGPRTMRQEVFELHGLLRAASVPPPYVLVGHSYGGLLVRVYATTYPSDVTGVVLVDPTHDNTRLSVQRRGDPQGTWVRVREGARGLSIPEPRRANGDTSQADGTYYWPDELQQLHQQRQANPVPFGDRPLIVLSGTRSSEPLGGTSKELWQELTREKDLEKEDLAKLSRNSKLVRDPSSGHHIQTDNPALVVSAIEQVVESVRNKTRIK